MGVSNVSETRLTSEQALILSKQLSSEVAKNKVKRIKNLQKNDTFPSHRGPTMSDKHYMSYIWDHIASIRADLRFEQWDLKTPAIHKFKGRFILGLTIKPCSYCGKRDMDGHEIQKCSQPCPRCDGSGCPNCKRWGMFSCHHCWDFGEVWVLADGQEVRLTDLAGQVSEAGSRGRRMLDYSVIS